MNRRNFFKDALSGIAALLIPSVLLQEENKPVLLSDVGKCEDSESRIKNVALYYEDGKYKGYYEFETPKHPMQSEVSDKIARVSSSWESILNEIPRSSLIRVNYRNKTC